MITPEQAGENSRINRPKLLLAKAVPCLDCLLLWHPVAMTLDHRNRDTKHVTVNGRRLDPSRMITHSPDTFDEMLALCDPVCMNCHALREMRRDKKAFLPRWKHYTYRIIRGALMR